MIVGYTAFKCNKGLPLMHVDTEISFFAPFVYVQKLDNPSLGPNMLQLCRAVQEIISINFW